MESGESQAPPGDKTEDCIDIPSCDLKVSEVKEYTDDEKTACLSDQNSSVAEQSKLEVSHEDKSTKKSTQCGECCQKCAVKCRLCCRPCLTAYNPLPANPRCCDRFRYAWQCPPHGVLARWLTLLLMVVLLFGALYGILGDEALPGSNIFALFVLVICCMIGGALVGKIRLPPLLGMLLVGCLLKNVPYIDIAEDIDPGWSSALRSMALVVILTRAGLGLDPDALRKLSFGVIRLAFCPCLAETITAAIASHLLLGFPWIWGFMLGFVLSAVSPAVVVPSMLALSEKGYGADKGIPTLVIAASSVDDVLAISGFGVVLGIAFSTGNIVLTVFKGPLEALAGVAYGILLGIFIWYLPHPKHLQKTLFRFVLLLCGGLLAQFVSRRADIAGAGALGALTLAFVAALMWRKECRPGEEMPMDKLFAGLWVIFQPLLFGLIGAEVKVKEIDPTTIGLGIAVLCIGLAVRMVVSFLTVFRLGLNYKEMFFIPIAWLPKATVQAAIGSIALDTARDKNPPDPDAIELGKQVLTIAVLVILITAPVGAAAIALSAPRLLQKRRMPSEDTGSQDGGHNEGSESAEGHLNGENLTKFPDDSCVTHDNTAV